MGYHPKAEQVARRFHEEYERLAPFYGYSTREASAKPWEDVPEQNKSLMKDVVSVLLYNQEIIAPEGKPNDPEIKQEIIAPEGKPNDPEIKQYTWDEAMKQFRVDL